MYFLIFFALAGALLFLYLTDDPEYLNYPKRKTDYLFGITIFSLFSIIFIFDYLNRRILYVINDNGIRLGNGVIVPWQRISHFNLTVKSGKNITYKQATLYDHDGREISIIDISHSDLSADDLEITLNEKIKLVAK